MNVAKNKDEYKNNNENKSNNNTKNGTSNAERKKNPKSSSSFCEYRPSLRRPSCRPDRYGLI